MFFLKTYHCGGCMAGFMTHPMQETERLHEFLDTIATMYTPRSMEEFKDIE